MAAPEEREEFLEFGVDDGGEGLAGAFDLGAEAGVLHPACDGGVAEASVARGLPEGGSGNDVGERPGLPWGEAPISERAV